MTKLEQAEQMIEVAGMILAGCQLHGCTTGQFFTIDRNPIPLIGKFRYRTCALGAILDAAGVLQSQIIKQRQYSKCYPWLLNKYPVLGMTIVKNFMYQGSLEFVITKCNDVLHYPREKTAEWIIDTAMELVNEDRT